MCHPQKDRTDEEIMKLLTTIMTNNDFIFNNELQVFGTAMGQTFTPNLANIYLIDLDQKAMEGFRIKPYLFYRFTTYSSSGLVTEKNWTNTKIS